MTDEATDEATEEAADLGDRAVRHGMRMNIVAGSMGMFWVAAVLGIPLTMFMEALGASGVLIGVTATVQQLSMLFQIPSALIAERLSRRKLFWGIVALSHRALWFVPVLLPVLLAGQPARMAKVMVWIVAVSAALGNGSAAAWWSWMADLIPERLRGSFWGRRQSLVTLSHLVGVSVLGWLLDLFPDPRLAGGDYRGFMLVFFIGAVMGCGDIIVHMWVPEPQPRPRRREAGWLAVILAPLRERDFVRATLAIGIWTFGIGVSGQFGFLYLKREFAASYTHLSAITIAASLGVVLAGVLWGYVMDRIGARNLGAITMLIAPLCGLVWFFMRPGTVEVPMPFVDASIVLPQPIVLLLVVNLFAGAFYSAVGLSQVGLMAGLAPRTGRTVAMAVHWSLVGLMAALGPVVGGALTDWLEAHPSGWVLPTGLPVGFFHYLVVAHMGIIWLGALPLLLTVTRRPGELEFRTAFARLMIGNPLRAVSSIYNIAAMNMAVTSRGRAEALSKIGAPQAAVAVSDLAEGLEDPAVEVREEAVKALGRIGTPEAIDVLLRKLNDPHADVVPEIMRALRSTRDPEVTVSIIHRLSDSDRETVSEAARALGEIGDARAARALLSLLQGSKDDQVIAAVSQALARLGEMAAIYEIVPRMSVTQNPVLKRSLAVAVGDLLGPPGEFYGSHVREHRNRGSELARLLGEVRAHLREVSDETPRRLQGVVRDLETAYESGDLHRCIECAHELALGIAMAHFGPRLPPAEGLAETLVWHDERFGVGVWYIDLVHTQSHQPGAAPISDTDVLLAIHFLAHWRG